MKTSSTKYLTILKQAGLKGDQALVYEALLKNGGKKASQLSNFTPFKRALCYKILTDLVGMGLVEKKEEPGKVAIFEPSHPLKIRDWINKQQEQYKNADLALAGFMPKLISDFNLAFGMPGIQIFEGLDGAKQVLDDSLTAQSEIYSYIDNEAVIKKYPEINQRYVEQRSKAKVKKKLILIDTPFVRERAKAINKSTTAVRLINSNESFTTVMQIYDTKVSYITWNDKAIISVIIDNPNISKMHKILFNTMWQMAKTVN